MEIQSQPILEYGAKIEEEIETIQNKETHIDELQKRTAVIKERFND